ncbi:MAG TPA: hypothetical protein VN030_14260 [Cellvibrio sp.]|nr:hypothetical protein [Cellvibrio sp.]
MLDLALLAEETRLFAVSGAVPVALLLLLEGATLLADARALLLNRLLPGEEIRLFAVSGAVPVTLLTDELRLTTEALVMALDRETFVFTELGAAAAPELDLPPPPQAVSVAIKLSRQAFLKAHRDKADIFMMRLILF